MTRQSTFWSMRMACALAALCIMLPAHAAVIYSNFGPGNTYNLTTGAPVLGTTYGPFTPAMSFTPAHEYALTQIDVAMSYVIAVDDSITLSLHSDSGGIPGGVLLSRTVNVTQPLGSSSAIVTMLPGSTVLLQQGTMYWIVAAATDPGTFDNWNQNSTGATGPLAVNLGSGFFSEGSGPLGAFDVLGDQVPEPITIALCGTGLGLLGVIRRFKR